jgi:hypothetical protein
VARGVQVALKALIEHVRQTTLSKDAYMQLQVRGLMTRQTIISSSCVSLYIIGLASPWTLVPIDGS